MEKLNSELSEEYIKALTDLNNAFKKVSEMNANHKEIGHFESMDYPFSENLQVMQKLISNWTEDEIRTIQFEQSIQSLDNSINNL